VSSEDKEAFGLRIFRVLRARLTYVDEVKGYINYVSNHTGKIPRYAFLCYCKQPIEFFKEAIENDTTLDLLIEKIRKGNLVDYLREAKISEGTVRTSLYKSKAEKLTRELERLSKEEVEFIHSIREEPWGQRIFRVFDCDGHILEFAESMESVVFRLDEQGLDVNEIASKSKMPLNFINSILSNKK